MLARVLALGCRYCESHHPFLSSRKCINTLFFCVTSSSDNNVLTAGCLAQPARDGFWRGGSENCKKVGTYCRQDEGRQLQVNFLLGFKVLANLGGICSLKFSGRRCWPIWTTPGLLTLARTCLPAARLTSTLSRSELIIIIAIANSLNGQKQCFQKCLELRTWSF